LERHAGRVGVRQHVEHIFSDDAGRRAAETEVEGCGFAGLQELRQAAGRIGGMDGERHAVDRHEHHWPQVRGGVARIFVERLVNGIAVAGEQQHIAVGRRAGDRFGGNVRSRACAVLDHNRKAGLLGQLLRHYPSERIDAAAGRKADDEGDGTAGIICRLGIRWGKFRRGVVATATAASPQE
jgi:hypothetical protein